MNAPLRFAVVGLGGYALAHLEAVSWLAQQGLAKLTAVVALESDRKKFPRRVVALQKQGVQLFEHVEDFYECGRDLAEVLTVPIGIHQHAPVSLAALRAGLHVYCEKPLAATVPEVDALMDARATTRRKIVVGFQHIYSPAIRQLKTRICAARFGRVQSISLLCGSPRSEQYYHRNAWAGKMRVGERWVLDSPANNAHAHYLLNLLYLASPYEHTAAMPHELRAELYRANPIESSDTVQMQFQTHEGVACHVVLTHANSREFGPIMKIIGEKGEAIWEGEPGKTVIAYKEGGSERFDNETHTHWRYEGFRDLVYAIRNDFAPLCALEVARSHTQTIQAMHASCPNIVTIPERYIDRIQSRKMLPLRAKENFYRIRGVESILQQAFASRKLFSELNVAWAA